MLRDRAHRLLAVASEADADQEAVHRGVEAVIEAFQRSTREEVAEALAILAQAYTLAPSDGQTLVLTLAGSAVEHGADPGPLVAPTIEFLRRATPLALAFHRACAPRDLPDGDDGHEAFDRAAQQQAARLAGPAAAWEAVADLLAPLIAVLAASPDARAQGRVLADDLHEIGRYNDAASWLAPMLRVLHREPLLVIEPGTGLGLVGTMSGISINFQLQVLLMDVFPHPEAGGTLQSLARRPGGGSAQRRVSQEAADIARGNVAEQTGEVVAGSWNLFAWSAVQATGSLPDGQGPDATSHWIWHEGVPADIPLFEGYRVVLLGKASYARQFKAQRDFLGLRADVEVERLLAGGEAAAWVERFRRAPRG